MILHTGKPYLRYAIESIIDQVDKLVILYSSTPSQGFQADVPCPDTRTDLYVEAVKMKPWSGRIEGQWLHDKIQWVDGSWANESEHTNAIWPYAEGYDWVWRLDADEVSPPGMVQEMCMQAAHERLAAVAAGLEPPGVFRVPFVHFWRCFNRVCRDGSQPIRLIKVGGGSREVTLDSKDRQWEVFHFGYAQPTRYIEYKMQVSGHRPEWRPSWFQDRWLANAQADVHPVCFPTHWMPEDFDKERLPAIMRKHPYWGMEVIE